MPWPGSGFIKTQAPSVSPGISAPGGYQVGGFPPGWGEWNDKYRDTVREYWQGDNVLLVLPPTCWARAISYDLRGRRPWASVNFITAHDGFTLNDLVSQRETQRR